MHTQPIINAFKGVASQLNPFIHLTTQSEYQDALALMDELFDQCADSESDPLNPLIDLVAAAISKYENNDPELVAFTQACDSIPQDIALVRTLIDQYKLTLSDLPEIGDKSSVSRFLNGKRELTKSAMIRLCQRFNLRPDMFFTLE